MAPSQVKKFFRKVDEQYSKCTLCLVNVKGNSNTTNRMAHLNKYHKNVLQNSSSNYCKGRLI